jgi:hypothetical protein
MATAPKANTDRRERHGEDEKARGERGQRLGDPGEHEGERDQLPALQEISEWHQEGQSDHVTGLRGGDQQVVAPVETEKARPIVCRSGCA